MAGADVGYSGFGGWGGEPAIGHVVMMFNQLLRTTTSEQNGKWRVPKPTAAVILLLVLGIVFAVFFFWMSATCPKERILRDVEKLFLEVRPMPNSQPVGLSPRPTYRLCHATMGGQYRLQATEQEVRRYYDAELAQHGWVFQKEVSLKDWGRDYGGKQFFYCRGEYTASIETAGQLEAENGWSYDFGVSWGLHDCGAIQTAEQK